MVDTSSTAGSAWNTAATSRERVVSRVGEMFGPAVICTCTRPVSSFGIRPPPAVITTSTASTPVSTSSTAGCQRIRRRWCIDQSSARRYCASSQPSKRSASRSSRPGVRLPSGSCTRLRPHRAGVRVSETTAEITMVATRVTANSRISMVNMLSPNTIGPNTAISDSVIDTTVKPISRTPVSAACSGAMPCSMWRTMFSITTIASSTTKPTHSTSATSEKMFRVKPSIHITISAPASDSGTLSMAIRVGRSRRRNSSITSATITMLMPSATSTSCSADSVVGVRSKIGVIFTSAGNTWLSPGSAARIALTTAIALASGRLLICRVTARVPLNQAAAYWSCCPPLTVATSASRTGTPLLLAITRLAKSAGVCSASLAVTVIWLTPSLRMPCGEVTLAARSALATWLVVMPLIASALAFSAMRTACGVPPPTCTCATPGICATAGLSRVSVRS